MVFVMISYQIISLTYDQRLLQLLMLNIGTRKIIYDNYNLFHFHDKLQNDKIIPNEFIISSVIPNNTTA